MKSYRVNEQIQENNVKLILEDGEMYGDISIDYAIEIANEKDLDLVEIAPANNGNLSICKLIDYGKLKYQEAKKKKQKKEVKKEIKVNLNISDHDLEFKNKKVLDFLQKGYLVKFSLVLKGRENALKDMAENKLNSILQKFAELAKWDDIKFSNKSLFVTLKPIVK